MLMVLVSLLLMMPLYEQLMAHFFVPKETWLEAPWKQLLGEIDLVKHGKLS